MTLLGLAWKSIPQRWMRKSVTVKRTSLQGSPMSTNIPKNLDLQYGIQTIRYTFSWSFNKATVTFIACNHHNHLAFIIIKIFEVSIVNQCLKKTKRFLSPET